MTQGGLLVLAFLGLRHGLDPDHIAAVDGMAFRMREVGSPWAPWCGALFGIGHGLVVTGMAIALGGAARAWEAPPWLQVAGDWVPIFLLAGLGIANLVALRGEAYRPVAIRTALLPRILREGVHPLSCVATGALFSLFFDTATQVALWGYAASSGGGSLAVALAGLAFTGGMVATDALDGWLLARLLKGDGKLATRYRMGVGYAVVALSLGMAAHSVLVMLFPTADLSPAWATFAGASCLLAAGWGLAHRKARS